MTILENRNWFLNYSAGNETFFYKQTKDNSGQYRVFRNGDRPDEEAFKKLFASIIYKLFINGTNHN